MKYLTAAFLALFLFGVLPLYAADLSDLTYTTTNSEVTITDCDEGATGELIIPDTIEGNPVTSIGDLAFYQCRSLTDITIPDSVTSIGDEAFYQCRSLTGITIPDGVTRIQSGTFLNCTSLTAIALPETLIGIGQGAFSRCSSLTDINIPQGVTAIIDFTFGNCTSLTTFTIPDNVTYIGAAAFYNCTGLTSMTIPEGVTTIGTQAFFRCTSLTSLTFRGPAPTTIYPGAFGRLADGAVANIEERFADSFGAAGSNWNGLILNFDRPTTITRCGFLNPTTFFIEFEPAGAGYRVMSSPTLDFGNAVVVTPTLEPTSRADNRFEFPVSGARNFYRIEPTE
tara:strand:- start:122 stop:1138 length:1017 start_codon:yes stop_codon:yes gene_type:complete